MKTIKLSLIMIVLSSTVANAQYDFAVGIRSGGTSGITLKNITSPTFAVEGIIGFWNDGLSITGLYERHPNAFGATGLHWTVGMGAHVAFYEADFRRQGGLAWFDDDRQINDGTFGIG